MNLDPNQSSLTAAVTGLSIVFQLVSDKTALVAIVCLICTKTSLFKDSPRLVDDRWVVHIITALMRTIRLYEAYISLL